MKIGITDFPFDLLFGGIEPDRESLRQEYFLSLFLQNIEKSLKSTCPLNESTENGSSRTLLSLLASTDETGYSKQESKSEDSPALLSSTNGFVQTTDVLSLLTARDYVDPGRTSEILCEKKGEENISQFEDQNAHFYTEENNFLESADNFHEKPEIRDSIVVEETFPTPLQVLANHGILVERMEEISVSPKNNDVLEEKNNSVLELNPGNLFVHTGSSEEWNTQRNKFFRIIRSLGCGSTCQFQRFVQKDRPECDKTFLVVPMILRDLKKIPVSQQSNQLSEENAQRIAVMDPEDRFLHGWKQERVYILKNQRESSSEMRKTIESKFEPFVPTEIEKESRGDQTADFSKVFLRVEILKEEKNLEKKSPPFERRHTESFEILSFQEKGCPLENQTIEPKDSEIRENPSIFFKRMDQVTEDIVSMKKPVDMFFKVRIEDGDPLILELKEEGERILINLRTEDKNLLSFFQTERESIRRDLDEKGIPANIFIGEKESGMAERKEKREKDERKFRKGGKVWV